MCVMYKVNVQRCSYDFSVYTYVYLTFSFVSVLVQGENVYNYVISVFHVWLVLNASICYKSVTN